MVKLRMCAATIVLIVIPAALHAEQQTVNCPTSSLQAAINKSKPGDSIVVAGVCRENITIGPDIARLILDGQRDGRIIGPDASTPAVLIQGRGITLRAFTISGGRDAINVTQGGEALIEGNILERAGRNGIEVNRASDAVLVHNTIQNNPAAGIVVSSNASARIGFINTADRTASPNIIRNNGGHGVQVSRSASARIAGNVIRGNKEDGVSVSLAAQADISGNTIEGNVSHGIEVRQNSFVQLGFDTGDGFLQSANDGSNGGVAVKCDMQSSVDGRLGSLTGKMGIKDFAATCVDSVVP